MRVGLHDADAEHFRGEKTFPNYALMKISAWYKKHGDTVEWWQPIYNHLYDRVYSSKIFDFTPANPFLPACTIKGGTGYDVKSRLPQEIDDMYPDYSIYPHCDYAIGFLTRGCIRKCPWCVVPDKEGMLTPYRRWQDVVRRDTDKVVLMDNNILACDYGVDQLDQLSRTDYRIDLNQGMDARLVTPEVAKVLAKIKWIRFTRFSCDTEAQIDSIVHAHDLLVRAGASPSRMFVYLLVRKDVDEAARRVDALKQLRGINLYAQAEVNPRLGIMPSAEQKEFAQRYVYGGMYRKETWEQYKRRKGLNF